VRVKLPFSGWLCGLVARKANPKKGSIYFVRLPRAAVRPCGHGRGALGYLISPFQGF